jgi:hypothetical protein
MAKQGGRPQRRLLRFVLSVPLALLAIVAIYAVASLVDGSLASLSVAMETAVAVSVLAVVLLGRFLLVRKTAASELRAEAEQAASALDDVRAVSWPPGKATAISATAGQAPRVARMPIAPSVRDPETLAPAISGPIRRAPAMAPAASVETSSPMRKIAARPPLRTVAANARVVPMPVAAGPSVRPAEPTSSMRVVPPPPPRPARIAPTPPTPPHTITDAGARRPGEQQSERDMMSADRKTGEASALDEYLNSRVELAHLIADVEARMPTDFEPEPPVVEPVPLVAHESRVQREARIESEREVVAEPSTAAEAPTIAEAPVAVAAPVAVEVPVAAEPAVIAEVPVAVEVPVASVPRASVELAVASEPVESDPALLLAQNTLVLNQAIEQVARASDLIAHACELFTERIESDRAERRALADAVLTLAQQLAPAPSTPRLVGGSVFASPARPREHEIVIDDDRTDASVSAPASASAPGEQSGSGSVPPAPGPRPSNWSAAHAPATQPTSAQPPPRFPGNRNGG